jgi:hypothetical protein
MVADSGFSAYTQRELRQLAKAFSLMGDEAVDEARNTSNALASYAYDEIRQAGYGRTVSARAVQRIVDGGKVSKTSKTGRISFGFASQRFSGGATTQQLWGGLEFGDPTGKYPQFPTYSGRYGAGARGWFIYPTLRRIQPELTRRWEDAINKVVKKWTA